MNLNVASQHRGVLAFAPINVAATNPAVDIRQHLHFAFTFQVMTNIAVEAVFEITAAPASDADPCVAGAFHDVPETAQCDWLTANPAADSKIAIPVGTKAGTICTATLPCRPDAFVKINAVSGDTNSVLAVVTLSGPR